MTTQKTSQQKITLKDDEILLTLPLYPHEVCANCFNLKQFCECKKFKSSRGLMPTLQLFFIMKKEAK